MLAPSYSLLVVVQVTVGEVGRAGEGMGRIDTTALVFKDSIRPECAGAVSEMQAAGGLNDTLSCVRASPVFWLSPDGYCVVASSFVHVTTGMCGQGLVL